MQEGPLCTNLDFHICNLYLSGALVKSIIFTAIHTESQVHHRQAALTLRSLNPFSKLQSTNLQNVSNTSVHLIGLLYGLSKMMLAISTLSNTH